MSADSSTPVRLSGRYVLGERLAVGGMGEVHVATDERLARQVAVKLLHRSQGSSEESVERFRREAVVVAGLLHPSIAQVYDYGVHRDGTDEAEHFIVMQLAPGADLAALLRRRGRLEPAEAVTIATQVCAALGAAHRAGVVHRDIKPGNVIVSPDLEVKVTDFGIARTLGQTSITDVGTILGTAAYLPPEQARGEAASPASDLYSLGILLYQMLTGRPPFDGETPVAVALRHLDEAVPPPSAAAPGIPPALDRVVAVATAKDPAQRYPDADAMAAALREVFTETAARAAEQARAAAARESAVAAAELTATAPMPVPVQPRRRAQPPAAVPDRRHPSRAAWIAAAAAALVLLVGGLTLLTGRPDAPRVASGAAVAPGPAAPTTSSQTSTRVPTSRAAAPTPAATPTTDAPPPTTADPAEGVGVPGGLVGSRADDARRTLEVMGLRVETVQVRSREDKGQVLATLPEAGITVRPGQTVVLVVSRGGGGKAEGRKQGSSSLTVPGWIVGSALDDVREELPEDLRVTTVRVPSSREEGTVVATWPGTGQELTDGQIVLVVAGAGDD
ncbi:protein kinase [Humibacillus xanthopallidus]|uniref:protein kinase domain-containing protein n=1 Tax=Humibacillus xanthopallidus TaxID=412689 RepID=UPI00384DAD75